MRQATTYNALETGDEILWDGKQQPLTVTAGKKEDNPIVTVEGPQGGEKMLVQNKHNPNNIAVESFSLSNNGEWITGLRILG